MTVEQKITQIEKALKFNLQFHISSLPEVEANLLHSICQPMKIKRREVLYRQGDTAKGLYILKSGKIKLFVTAGNGDEQIHFISTPDEVLGYRAVFNGSQHEMTPMALEDCELLFIDKDKFLASLDVMPVFTKSLVFEMSRMLTVSINRSSIVAQKTIIEKLSLALLLLNEKYRHPNSVTNVGIIKLYRKDIASYIATSIEVLVRNLKTFEKLHLVKLSGKEITILNFEKLYKMANVDDLYKKTTTAK